MWENGTCSKARAITWKLSVLVFKRRIHGGDMTRRNLVGNVSNETSVNFSHFSFESTPHIFNGWKVAVVGRNPDESVIISIPFHPVINIILLFRSLVVGSNFDLNIVNFLPNGARSLSQHEYSVPSRVWTVPSLPAWKFWKIRDDFDPNGQLDSIEFNFPSRLTSSRNFHADRDGAVHTLAGTKYRPSTAELSLLNPTQFQLRSNILACLPSWSMKEASVPATGYDKERYSCR